jgi:hypothetical protein
MIAWLTAARWRLSAIHCVVALPIQLITAFFFNFWVGAYAVVIFFYSRKLIECEEEVKIPGQSHATVWTAGILPWTWEKSKMLDVLLPTVSSYLIAFLLG